MFQPVAKMEPEEAICILPDDLFEGILSRVPVKDLLRFRCVSKAWRALIDDPSFIWMHHHVQYARCKAEGNVPLLFRCLSSDPNKCYLLLKQGNGNGNGNEDVNGNGNDVVLNLTSDLVRERNSSMIIYPDIIRDETVIIGSANGIICLEIEFTDQDETRFICCGLWNPAIRDFKIIPYLSDLPDQRQPLLFSIISFMFDTLSNDFKMLVKTVLDSDKLFAYLLYSLSTNSWKRLSEPSFLGSPFAEDFSTMDSCFNGVYYWSGCVVRIATLPAEGWRLFWILSFNFRTEEFVFTDPPFEALPPVDYYDSRLFSWDIGMYKECLALFFAHHSSSEDVASIDIWVVTEFDDDFGAPLAWQCVFRTGTFPAVGIHVPLVRTPQVDGDIPIIMANNILYLYNPTTREIRSLDTQAHYCFQYVESLFPLSRRVCSLMN